jgi:hypothetical protein
MAKNKAALQHDYDRHRALMIEARSAVECGDYQKAVHVAVSALEHVDGMMQFYRRFMEGKEFKSVDSVDLVLKYAPLLFDASSLQAIAELLKSQRRIEKNTTADLGSKLSDANSLMWNAHRLWRLLEEQSFLSEDSVRSNLGEDGRASRCLIETWDQMGVVIGSRKSGSYILSLVTKLNEPISGKCSSCGSIRSAPKIEHLQEFVCVDCKTAVYFVLLDDSR